MRLIASLTTLATTTVLAAVLAGCAGNAPKRPTSEQDKSARASALDRCSDDELRGGSAFSSDCPETANQRRTRNGQPLPNDPLQQLPGMPGLGLPSGGSVLGR